MQFFNRPENWPVVAICIAMVAAGPRPGRTPTSVPSTTPTKHQNMLIGVSATENPSRRLPRASTSAISLHSKSPEAGGQRDVESGNEDQLERRSETDGDDDGEQSRTTVQNDDKKNCERNEAQNESDPAE